MKKYIAIYSLILTVFFAGCQSKENPALQPYKAQLASQDVNVAQNTRLQIQDLKGADYVLIEAYKNEKNPILKEGLIYSLGKIKSKEAFDIILKEAKENNSKAAILALVEYDCSKAKNALAEISKLCKTDFAERALSMTDEKKCCGLIPTKADYDKASANDKIAILEKLPRTKEAKVFLDSLVPEDKRATFSIIEAYSKIPCPSSAEKIVELSKNYKTYNEIAQALAKVDNAEKTLVSEINKDNVLAIKAAAIRRSAECEDAVLNIALKDNDLTKISVESLKQLGTLKSFNALGENINNDKVVELPAKVATLMTIYSNLNDADRAIASKALDKLNSSASEKTKEIYKKILTVKLPVFQTIKK